MQRALALFMIVGLLTVPAASAYHEVSFENCDGAVMTATCGIYHAVTVLVLDDTAGLVVAGANLVCNFATGNDCL